MRHVICCLFALMTMVSLNVNAYERPTSPEAKGAWMTATPSEIDAAIYHILELEPAHHLRKDAVARMALSEKIVKVSEEKGVPPLFALAIIFRESSFEESWGLCRLLKETFVVSDATWMVPKVKSNVELECFKRHMKHAVLGVVP
jgi:hypothetical protein